MGGRKSEGARRSMEALELLREELKHERLIKTELLEAANAMCFVMDFTPADIPGALEFDLTSSYNKLRAAIAKAEGT